MTGFSEFSTPQPELPRPLGTSEETAQLRQELDYVNRYPERRATGYQAEFPQIIGDVSPQDRETFSSLPENTTGTFTVTSLDAEQYERIRASLPSVWQAIEDDCERLGLDSRTVTCTVKRGLTIKDQESFRPDDGDFGWHTDRKVTYVVSDAEPTQFYAGQVAPLHGHAGGRITPLELDKPGTVTEVSPYAIVRIMPYTAHRAAVATQEAMRTFMSFDAQQNIADQVVF